MNKVVVFLLALITVSLSSCTAIADIFKAGAWTAIIGIVIVVAIIFWIVSKVGGGNKS